MALKKIIWACAAIVIGGLCGFGYLCFSNNTNFHSNTKDLLIIKGSTFENLNTTLREDSIVKNLFAYHLVSKILRFNDNSLKLGRYSIKKNTSTWDLVRKLRSGNQDAIKLTVNNVRDIPQLTAKISNQLAIDSNELLQILIDSSFLDSIHYTKDNVMSLFIPNTYEVYYTIRPEKLIAKFQSEHEKYWSENNRREKIKAKNIDEAQAYTLASIVEKESIYEPEKATIAGVYLNRLARGEKLQADPTVVFALGLFGIQRILFEHLTTPSPYNTYMINGLPPGPICMPSGSSLEAVINAENHEYLFFCAKPGYDGSHNFAKTYQAHLQNAAIYRTWLDQENIK